MPQAQESQSATPQEGRFETGIKSVHLTVDILEQIATKGEIGVSELAAQLGFTKATIYRHLQTLLERGYIAQNADNSRYQLGIRAYLLGQAAGDRIDLLSAARDAMRQLVEATGQTAVLSSVGTGDVTVVYTLLGKSSVEIGVRPGSTLALHASSQGKVALAFAPSLFEQLRQQPLQRFTEFTIEDEARLAHELEMIRQRGWASAPEELILGLNSISGPVLTRDKRCIATLAIVGSIQFIRRNPDADQVRHVVEACASASRELGYVA